ncbi:hypothetical protein ACRRVB_00870 [Candidatus Cardinium hertigii]|uniref:hypothetical protein n=1 Tax=Candidatus Cardinium hertigii TaxID=247481 RepID=UPI003D7DC17F
MSFATFNIKGYKSGLIGIGRHIDRSSKELKKTGLYEDEAEKSLTLELGLHIDPSRIHLNEELVDTGVNLYLNWLTKEYQKGIPKRKLFDQMRLKL